MFGVWQHYPITAAGGKVCIACRGEVSEFKRNYTGAAKAYSLLVDQKSRAAGTCVQI